MCVCLCRVVVIQQLLNVHFWVKSLEMNNNIFYYENLTTNRKMSLTHENFVDKIDMGAPLPNESGLVIFFFNSFLATHL